MQFETVMTPSVSAQYIPLADPVPVTLIALNTQWSTYRSLAADRFVYMMPAPSLFAVTVTPKATPLTVTYSSLIISRLVSEPSILYLFPVTYFPP
jgi:hypothetical protein